MGHKPGESAVAPRAGYNREEGEEEGDQGKRRKRGVSAWELKKMGKTIVEGGVGFIV